MRSAHAALVAALVLVGLPLVLSEGIARGGEETAYKPLTADMLHPFVITNPLVGTYPPIKATPAPTPGVIIDSVADPPFPDTRPKIKQPAVPIKTEVKATPRPQYNGPTSINGGSMSAAHSRKLAKNYALSRIGSAQFACLEPLWERESGWWYRAENRSSGAYGIPQALPGSKMASAGDDWRTNPITQVKWGLGYVSGRYGSACEAWSFWKSHGWY